MVANFPKVLNLKETIPFEKIPTDIKAINPKYIEKITSIPAAIRE
jgi:hypothetical protein